MVTILGHWENAVAISKSAHAQKKMLSIWNITMKAFGANRLFLIDVDNTEPFIGDAEIEFGVFGSLEDALTQLPGTFVYVERGGTPLPEFDHPRDAVYILGSNYGELNPPDGALVVSVDADLPLHAEVVLGIVLNDRRMKIGS